MIEIRFEGKLGQDLLVVIVDHEEKTYLVTDLETAANLVDFEANDIDPSFENVDDLWLHDEMPFFLEHWAEEGYKEIEA